MAYDRNFIVPIPKDTIEYHSGGKTYLYRTVEKVYRKKEKNNSDVRLPVGLKIDGSDTMYINNNFKKLYKVEYEALNENNNIDSNKFNFSDGITYGQTAVLHKLSEKINLTPYIKKHFDDENNIRSNTLINLATKFVLTNNSSIVSYPHFARNNLILGHKIESDTTVENILGQIKESQIDSFLEDWVLHTCKDKDIVISIDGSNVQTEASDIEIVELGLSKNKDFENQFSFTLVTDQEQYTPIYYKEYKGTIHDLNQAYPIIKVLKKGEPKSINFVLDRGYFSKDLMKIILKSNNGFLMMTKENKQIREIIDLYSAEIFDVRL